MLRLDTVTAGYGDVSVLRDISIDVRRGEAVALLGRNGMGKTTTLRTIMGLTRIGGGRVTFDGRDVTRLRPYEIARLGVGYAPEGRQLFGPLSVLENLRIPFVNKQPDRSRWPAQLARVFDLFPVLAERRDQQAGSLSGGEQQMLAIARAMVGGDRCLVLDEPTEGLAPAVVTTIVDVLKRLKADGLTVLLVEQNIRSALAIADRVYLIEKGRIELSTPTAELKSNRPLLERCLGVGRSA
jgi:branched-chain amino acid transport system ATP-binding protein